MSKLLFKKISAILLALVLAIGTSTTVFATQADELNNVQDATVQYYVSGTYTIDIPSYIDVSYATGLYASELNIAPDSYISVELFQIPEGGVYTLTHTASSSNTVGVTLSGDFGTVTPTQPVLAKFTADSNMSTLFAATLTEESQSASLKAGTYSGTVTFNFVLHQNGF